MPEFTIALAGQRGVGKTSIFRHVKKDLEESVDPTSLEAGGRIDCCYYQVKLDGIDFKVMIQIHIYVSFLISVCKEAYLIVFMLLLCQHLFAMCGN